MSNDHRIAVFTGNLSYSVRKRIVQLDRAMPGLSWLVLLHSPPKTPARLLRNQWRNFRRNGWRWIPHQTLEILHQLRTQKAVELCFPACASEFTLTALRSRPNLQVITLTDINSSDAQELVRGFRPELGLSLSAPILQRALFSIPRLGTINLHMGALPDYRGMPPAFWELWHGEKSVGCTVHWVDEHLDTGDVVCATQLARERFSTVRGLQLQLDEIGIELLCEAVRRILSGSAVSSPQPRAGRTHRRPTLAQIATLNRKLRHDRPRGAAVAKRLIKSGVARVAFGIWRAGLYKLARPRVTVLLFHRVSDDARDNMTVGVEQFDRQMALLHRHCRLLSIEEVVESDVLPRSRSPLVCVTFDDGYLDNYRNAVPILLRHGIPAAFFVCTGVVGSKCSFAHDVRRGYSQIATMQWDDLRHMRQAGFTIGSHSVSHIDCAAENEQTVRAELAQSLDDLRHELGLHEALFAYPYGGLRHMTSGRLELVKQAGYRGCLSAYGGANIGSVDRFNVLRHAIHWEFTDSVLLFKCLGLR